MIDKEKITKGAAHTVLLNSLNQISDGVNNCLDTVPWQMAKAMEFIALAERNGVDTKDFIDDFVSEGLQYKKYCACLR